MNAGLGVWWLKAAICIVTTYLVFARQVKPQKPLITSLVSRVASKWQINGERCLSQMTAALQTRKPHQLDSGMWSELFFSFLLGESIRVFFT